MTTRIVTFGVLGLLLNAFFVGYAYGFDSAAISMFFGLVLLGALAIAVARGRDKGMTAPAQCTACSGLISPHAPYCKHCGEPVEKKP